MTSARFDAVIVGGGHNGLACAAYLAGAGLSVCVLERRGVVGGAAVTEEFHPGLPQFDRELHGQPARTAGHRAICSLAAHGLTIVERPLANFLPLPDDALPEGRRRTRGDAGRGRELLARATRARCPATTRCSTRVADVLRELLHVTPPNVGAHRGGRVGWRSTRGRRAKPFRALDRAGQRDVLDLFTKSAGEFLDRWFESAPIKAAFGFDAVVGNFASPYTPGSAYVLLHHVFGEVNGKRGQWGHAIGGMGAITQAMAKECVARGVTIRTACRRARA